MVNQKGFLRSLMIGVVPGMLLGAVFSRIRTFPQHYYVTYFTSLTVMLVALAIWRSARIGPLILGCYFGIVVVVQAQTLGHHVIVPPVVGVAIVSFLPMATAFLIVNLWDAAKSHSARPMK